MAPDGQLLELEALLATATRLWNTDSQPTTPRIPGTNALLPDVRVQDLPSVSFRALFRSHRKQLNALSSEVGYMSSATSSRSASVPTRRLSVSSLFSSVCDVINSQDNQPFYSSRQ